MHTELYSLSKIFTENLFRIPDYQRGYSWTARQLKDFWSDLVLLETGRDHYTGVLTLEEVNASCYNRWTDDLWIIDSKRYRPYYVVDGQQRLTTSLVLLQCLLENVKGDDELNYSTNGEIRKKYIFETRDKKLASRSYIFGYEKDNPSYEYLKTRIFLEPSDNHELGEETIYTHNLLAAKKFFAEKLNGMQRAQLEEIFTKLTQHFLFNIYTIAGTVEVFVAFETMNNRGKPLSHLELLKNRLIFLSTRLGVDSTEKTKVRSVVNEAWKTAYHYLGKNQKKPLEDDRFLRIHFILYVGPTLYDDKGLDTNRAKFQILLREEEYKNYLLDELFTSRNIPRVATLDAEPKASHPDRRKEDRSPLSTQAIYAYAHDLKQCVQVYYKVMNPEDSDLPGDQKLVLTQLNRLGWYDSLPLILTALLYPKSDEAVKLLSSVERHLFLRILTDLTHRINEGPDLIVMALRLKKEEISLKEIVDKINSISQRQIENIDTAQAFSGGIVNSCG